jgi:hypothetical protein
MPKRSLLITVVLLAVAACGTPSTTPEGPTASSVAVQSGDLPAGMQKCSVSGDIASFLSSAKSKDPSTYASFKKFWDEAQTNGATAVYIAMYTDSSAHCSALESNTSDISTADYKLGINFVVQFKDEASAAKAYTSESIFGFSTASLTGGGAPALQGAQTGLSPNAVVLSVAVANISYYVAVWQNKAFMVILAIVNVDPAAAKKAALAENGRIK